MKRAVPIALALMFALHVPATKAQSAPPRTDIPAIAKAANGSIVSIVTSKDGQPKATSRPRAKNPLALLISAARRTL